MYNMCVGFEWDEPKSKIDKAKHGIDFQTARNLWLDENRIQIHASHPIEDRSILIAKHDNKVWAAVYTMRRDRIRIISVRRARERERDLYEKENLSQE